MPASVQTGSSSPQLAFRLEAKVWGSSVPGCRALGTQRRNVGKKTRLLPPAAAARATEVQVEVLNRPGEPAASSNPRVARTASGTGAEPSLKPRGCAKGSRLQEKARAGPVVLGFEQPLCGAVAVTLFSLDSPRLPVPLRSCTPAAV